MEGDKGGDRVTMDTAWTIVEEVLQLLETRAQVVREEGGGGMGGGGGGGGTYFFLCMCVCVCVGRSLSLCRVAILRWRYCGY